jgi:hypothetical protein
MPRAVFKLLWDTLKGREELFAYVVNLASDGAHYWVAGARDAVLRRMGQVNTVQQAAADAVAVLEAVTGRGAATEVHRFVTTARQV